MDDKKQTKSSDFLPGKPSTDSSTPITMSSSTKTVSPSRETTSAHVIDLKKSAPSIADSPLVKEENNKLAVDIKVPTVEKNPENETVKDSNDSTKNDPVSPTENKVSVNNEEDKKGINDISLASTDNKGMDSSEPLPKKKSGKLKIILIVIGVVAAIAIAVGAVILLTSSPSQ